MEIEKEIDLSIKVVKGHLKIILRCVKICEERIEQLERVLRAYKNKS